MKVRRVANTLYWTRCAGCHQNRGGSRAQPARWLPHAARGRNGDWAFNWFLLSNQALVHHAEFEAQDWHAGDPAARRPKSGPTEPAGPPPHCFLHEQWSTLSEITYYREINRRHVPCPVMNLGQSCDHDHIMLKTSYYDHIVPLASYEMPLKISRSSFFSGSIG